MEKQSFKETLQELAQKARIHPILPTKYNAKKRKELREFEQSLFPTSEDKKKFAEAIEGEQKEQKVILSPVFSTQKQEEEFAEIANETMGNTRLECEEGTSTYKGKTKLVSPFHSKEQEKEFAEIAKKAMNETCRLKSEDEEER